MATTLALAIQSHRQWHPKTGCLTRSQFRRIGLAADKLAADKGMGDADNSDRFNAFADGTGE